MIKLFRNNFLSMKVSFCNEIEEFCSRSNINYENVINLAILDSRIGESHTKYQVMMEERIWWNLFS